MKVLQLSKFYPPAHGGIEAVAGDLSAGLVRRGVQVEVLCANTRWRRQIEVDALGVRITRSANYGMVSSISNSPSFLRLFRRLYPSADVLHVHMPDPLAALAVWLARPDKPVVLHWHSDVVRQRITRRMYGPLERWLLARADAIIATSRPYADSSTVLRNVLHKVQVIPIGTSDPIEPAPIMVDEVRKRYAGRRIVFALGRMTYYKGYEVLIAAASGLPPGVVLVIGGGGPALQQYRALAQQAGVADRVRFVGPLTAMQVEAHFRAAEVFCLASTVRAEAYGVVVAEAMARGLPVVATRIPGSGLNWLHQDGITGLAVPVNDAPALAAAVTRLLDDAELRRRCGQAARARWVGHLTAQTMCDRTLELYRRVLAEQRQPALPCPPPDTETRRI